MAGESKSIDTTSVKLKKMLKTVLFVGCGLFLVGLITNFKIAYSRPTESNINITLLSFRIDSAIELIWIFSVPFAALLCGIIAGFLIKETIVGKITYAIFTSLISFFPMLFLMIIGLLLSGAGNWSG